MNSKPTEISTRRGSERGAALVTALMVAMLLLAAGGALVATAGMSASNAVDATAEAQAYYAADAGLQAALSVMRRNRAGTGGLAANFHNFACGSASACTNNGDDLSSWLTYDGTTGRVTLDSALQLSYSVTVTDPSKADTANLAADYTPQYLLVRSVGRGPKGATKVLEMMVDDFAFAFTVRAAVAIRSDDDDPDGMPTFAIGNSNPHLWNGNDTYVTSPAPPVPAFAVTNRRDYDGNDSPSGLGGGTVRGIAEAAISNNGANVIGASQLAQLNVADLETWLQTAENARDFLTEWRLKAAGMGRLNPTNGYGTDAEPKFSFVDGDVTLHGSQGGAGLLIVTGTYTQSGSAPFNGIVLALGDGNVDRNGTPGINGALVVAKFEHTYNEDCLCYEGSSDFLAPSVRTSGGGNSLVGYNSDWVKKAMGLLGHRVLGVVEK
jgi:type II secretory pathway pseudopilin PulG